MEPANGPMPIDFDDLIYALQKSGGASNYWTEITSRIGSDPRFRVRRRSASRQVRGIPVWSGARVFHSSHFRTCMGGGAKTVSTVHDLNYELGLVPGGVGTKVNTLERRLSYFTADALVCISENTRKDLCEVYPALARRCEIRVIHHGCSTTVLAAPAESSGALEAVGSPFVLYVGGRKAYKGFGVALEGFRASGVWRDGVRLVCTGAPFDGEERALITKLGLDGAVHALENVSREMLTKLYRGAHCLLYTSSYEGFGLPPLEAMALGCPVIGCNASSIPEVTGDAAILVAPGSVDGVARGILALQDPIVKRDLVDRGRERSRRFSWDESARRHADLYLSLGGRSR